MKLYWFCISVILLVFVSSCTTVPTSIGFPKDQDKIEKNIVDVGYEVEEFVTMSNLSHPGNRIGYRFHENLPFVHGQVPKKPETRGETIKADVLEKQYAARAGVFVNTIDVTDKKGWAEQEWTFYLVPVIDGFELLWVVETKEKGLNEYYVGQECFRLGGKSNRPWRRTIAEAPAFSEFKLWAEQQFKGEPRKSLSFVRRDNKWESIAATDERTVCRTAMGFEMDMARTGGDLTKIDETKPPFNRRGTSKFEADIDCGLVTRTNVQGDWVCGLYWENTTHISNHHPADCLHSYVNIGPLGPHSKRAIRGRIYWMKASKDELFARWQKDWVN